MISILLLMSVVIIWLCCAGLLVMRGPYAKLHYLGPVSSLGVVIIAAAVVVKHPISSNTLQAVVVALVLLLTNPVLAHATALAAQTYEQKRSHTPEAEGKDES